MWPVTEMTRRSSATHARADELRAGPVRLIDAIQLCAWNDENVHLEHCDYCGGDDVSGSWIALRRAGDRVLWMPAFGAMGKEPIDWSSEEYAPPDYVRSAASRSSSRAISGARSPSCRCSSASAI